MSYLDYSSGMPMAGRPMIDYSNMANWGGPNAGMMPQVASPTPEVPVIDMSTMASPMTMSAAAQGPSFMDGMLGYRKADGTQMGGWGGMALSAGSALLSGYTGLEQLGLYKDQLAQSKKQFELNFGAQQKMTNSRLADRQAARVAAAAPGTYESVGDYMKKYGV